MRDRTSASQACGSTSFILSVTIKLYITAARSPPRPEPQNSHDLRPSGRSFRARNDQCRFQRFDVVWQRFKAIIHSWMESQKPRFGAVFLQSHEIIAQLIRLSGALRPPAVLRVSPVHRLQQIAHLSCGQRHHAVHRCRPDEAATIQPFRIKRESDPIVPKSRNQRAGTTTEHKDVPGKRILAPGLLAPAMPDPACLCACRYDQSRSRSLRPLRSGSSPLQKVQHSRQRAHIDAGVRDHSTVRADDNLYAPARRRR